MAKHIRIPEHGESQPDGGIDPTAGPITGADGAAVDSSAAGSEDLGMAATPMGAGAPAGVVGHTEDGSSHAAAPEDLDNTSTLPAIGDGIASMGDLPSPGDQGVGDGKDWAVLPEQAGGEDRVVLPEVTSDVVDWTIPPEQAGVGDGTEFPGNGSDEDRAMLPEVAGSDKDRPILPEVTGDDAGEAALPERTGNEDGASPSEETEGDEGAVPAPAHFAPAAEEMAEGGSESTQEEAATGNEVEDGGVEDDAARDGGQQTDSDTPKTATRERLRLGLRIGAGVLGALLLVYLGGLVLFSSRFVPGTMVGGIDASWLTVDELARRAEETASSYTCTIEGDGISLTLNAADMGLTVDGSAFATAALDLQEASSWPRAIANGTSLVPAATATVDEARCATRIDEAVNAHNASASAPQSAYVAYDDATGRFEVVAEQLAEQVNAEAVTARVVTDAGLLYPTTTLGEDELARPRYLQDQTTLQRACEQANRIVATKIHLKNEGQVVTDVAGSLSHEWVTVLYEDDIATLDTEPAQQDADATEEDLEEGEDYFAYDEDEGDEEPEPWTEPDTDVGTVFESQGEPRVSVRVNRPAIHDWATGTLAGTVDGETETRTWVLDAWETAGVIKDALTACRNGDLDVVTTTIEERPPESEGHETRGRHIDVNLTTQYARLYDSDGTTVLWRTDIVSGMDDGSHNTPTGEYEIETRALNITMVGADEDGDGEPDYRTPCNFWMGFYGGVGIHDSWWRYYYGEDIYEWDGSHGCVNVSYEKAEELWNLTDYGDKVYVHY